MAFKFTDSYTNSVIRGPPAQSESAVEFQAFWGRKAKLTRFPDAEICESALFPASSLAQKRLIPKQIVEHLLKKYFDIPGENITYLGNMFTSLLRPLRVELPENYPVYDSGQEYFNRMDRSFNLVIKALRDIRSLPLSISNVYAMSDELRQVSVIAPIPAVFETEKYEAIFDRANVVKIPPFVPVLKLSVIMESSGKWPDTTEAIRRLKSMFYAKMVDSMRRDLPKATVMMSNVDGFDVYLNGYVFRIKVCG